MYTATAPHTLPPPFTPVLLRLDASQLAERSDDLPNAGHCVGYFEPKSDNNEARFRGYDVYTSKGNIGTRRGAKIPLTAVTGWMEIPA